MMDAAERAEMDELLDHQGAGELTSAERVRLQDLLDTYGRLMVRKAHAYLLLARRGYRVPMQEAPMATERQAVIGFLERMERNASQTQRLIRSIRSHNPLTALTCERCCLLPIDQSGDHEYDDLKAGPRPRQNGKENAMTSLQELIAELHTLDREQARFDDTCLF